MGYNKVPDVAYRYISPYIIQLLLEYAFRKIGTIRHGQTKDVAYYNNKSADEIAIIVAIET